MTSRWMNYNKTPVSAVMYTTGNSMTAVLPGNENGGWVIAGNYLEITITMEITWKL